MSARYASLLRMLALLAAFQRAAGSLDVAADETGASLLSLIRMAAGHDLLPLLGVAIADGRLRHVPEPVRSDLLRAAELNRDRNHRIRAETDILLADCRAVGVLPVLLKGAAMLRQADDSYLAGRLVGDIDFLVPAQAMPALARRLAERGFASNPGLEQDAPELKHYPRLIAGDCLAPLEMHRELAEVAWRHVLPAADVLRRAVRTGEPAGAWLRMCVSDRLLHAFIHDQLDNRGWWHGHAALRTLHDVTCLLTGPEQPDWVQMDACLAEPRLRARFRIWLSWLGCLQPDILPSLPFRPDARAIRYARATAGDEGLWRWWLAEAAAELEQLRDSRVYRRRAWRRLLTPAAWRERGQRLLLRLRESR